MENVLPVRMKVTISLMLLIGAFYLWDWIGDNFVNSGMLVMGAAHILLAISLYLKLSAGRAVTLVLSVGGVLLWLFATFFSGLMGFALNSDEAQLNQVLLSEGEAQAQVEVASAIQDAFQMLPWLIVVEGVVFIALYSWIFYYLTTAEASAMFRKSGE